MEEEKLIARKVLASPRCVAALNVPEYRLRRMINQRWAIVTSRQLRQWLPAGEATRRLADPAQADVPVRPSRSIRLSVHRPVQSAFKAHTHDADAYRSRPIPEHRGRFGESAVEYRIGRT